MRQSWWAAAESWYRATVLGTTTGMTADIARGLLFPPSWLYAGVVHWRNRQFDRRLRRVERLPVPVISIGNLTVGGTGKTPVVAAVAQLLLELGYRPGIVSRGYGTPTGILNDEARVLGELLPGLPQAQHPRRVIAARHLLSRHVVDCLVLDDGFQHRQLARDLDIALVDATNTWGGGRLLPAGLLREPVAELNRADLVLLTRSEAVEERALGELIHQVRRANSSCPIIPVGFPLGDAINSTGNRRTIAELTNERCLVFCGIGNPESFLRGLRARGLGPAMVASQVFPDHAVYGSEELSVLRLACKRHDATMALCTRKDFVKLPALIAQELSIWSVSQEVDWGSQRFQVCQILRNMMRVHEARLAA